MVRTIGGNWDSNTVDDINYNFDEVSGIEGKVIKDILETDKTTRSADVNGAYKPSSGALNNASDYGANFRAEVNGIIHATQVYSNTEGVMGFGLVEQEVGSVAGAIISYTEIHLNEGWNRLILNFPITQGTSYTMFKRHLPGSTPLLRQERHENWAGNQSQWIGESLFMQNGRFLNSGAGWLNIFFFEIEVITNLVEVFHIMSSSVEPIRQFYVGQNPPNSAQFWFRPEGG